LGAEHEHMCLEWGDVEALREGAGGESFVAREGAQRVIESKPAVCQWDRCYCTRSRRSERQARSREPAIVDR
jgi:hypothetical protein